LTKQTKTRGYHYGMKYDEFMRYVEHTTSEKPKRKAEKQNLKPIQALKNLNCNLIKAK